MINYPNINPVILHITDTLQIRWYGVMYLVGFALAWLVIRVRTKNKPGWENKEKLNDLIFYVALGAVLGGRIGYCLFYALPVWIHHPSQLFRIWEGGMSFHGGLLGVVIATLLFVRHYHEKFWDVADIIAPAVPLGLAAGRLGNFINGELWGKVTDVPWAMVFPQAGHLPRHPFPLYAIFLEGFLLFIILWFYSAKPHQRGAVSGVFFLGYGTIRIFEEFYRMPDPQYGYLAWDWLTMGQILCLPMLLVGLFLLLIYPRCERVLCKPI